MPDSILSWDDPPVIGPADAEDRRDQLVLSITGVQHYFQCHSRTEALAAVALFALGWLFKFWNLLFYRFDSDEPQHLHVIWGWTHGLVQYRDLFDNHMPLFQIMCAPILGLMGEHATDLYWMRVVMLPLYGLTLWAVYRLGAIIFSRRLGLWGMLLASGLSVFHFCSTEFRPDNAWVLLWYLCLIVIVTDPLAVRSYLVSGLLLGLAFGVSMKSTLMLLTTVLAWGIAAALVGWRRLGLTSKKLVVAAAVFAGCTAVVPLVVTAFFATKGVWADFRYCVFVHNIEPATLITYLKPLMFVGGMPLVIWAAGRFIKSEADPVTAFRRAFLGLTCGSFFLILQGFWRHLTREDYMALFPLLALVSVGLLSKVPNLLERHQLTNRIARVAPLFALAAWAVMIFDLGLRLPWTNEGHREFVRVRDVLLLTDPSDRVFDCKGESIFRPRSVRYVIESITSGRIERGQTADEFDAQPIPARPRVVVVGGEIAERAAVFIRDNYVAIDDGVMVAGYKLGNGAANQIIHFHVAMPDRYEVVSPTGPVTGLLDGIPALGARFLTMGEHTFVPDTYGPPLAVIWAQAAERHFTNFQTAPELRTVPRQSALTNPVQRMVDISGEIPDRFIRAITISRLWNRSSP